MDIRGSPKIFHCVHLGLSRDCTFSAGDVSNLIHFAEIGSRDASISASNETGGFFFYTQVARPNSQSFRSSEHLKFFFACEDSAEICKIDR